MREVRSQSLPTGHLLVKTDHAHSLYLQVGKVGGVICGLVTLLSLLITRPSPLISHATACKWSPAGQGGATPLRPLMPLVRGLS